MGIGVDKGAMSPAVGAWTSQNRLPKVAMSSPAMRRSNVLLPQPDGPRMATKPPWRTVRLTESSALVPSANIRPRPTASNSGVAWVSADGTGGWFAIDKNNRVVIQSAFDDVRPFRRGIAVVRQQGRWGAVERDGRLAVQFAFDGFATGLADGRYVEGFTDEGLAIAEVGGRKGVIDRTGRVLVPLAYPTLVIHPVAFLFTDPSHRWGALGRDGSPLIEPRHASRQSVTDELEQLLADTRPLL